MNNYLLLPFALYGLFKFAKWWFVMTWQKESDAYNTKDDWFALLLYPVLFAWVILSIAFFSVPELRKEIMLAYFLLTYFGPLTLVMGFMRACGFGKTPLGKKLGCYPSTKLAGQ